MPSPAPTVTVAPDGLVLVPGTTGISWSSIAGDDSNTNLVATVDGGKVCVRVRV
jgi:hypothetical protein